LHLDADILDPAIMPAVDSPDPGGLGHDELAALLTTLVTSPHCVGLDVTTFDPDLDPDSRLARGLTDTLVTALPPALTYTRRGMDTLPWYADLAGRIEHHVIDSALLRGNPLDDPHERPLWVYVPPGYDDEPDRSYPSVYVIQGYSGHIGMWLNRTP